MPTQNNKKTESIHRRTGGKHEQNSVDKKSITKPPSSEKMPRKK
ncbi:hypothetical protein [Oceanobacillus sp. FSL W7-1293]